MKCSLFLNDININAVLGDLEATHNHHNVSPGQSLFRDTHLGSNNDRESMLLLLKWNRRLEWKPLLRSVFVDGGHRSSSLSSIFLAHLVRFSRSLATNRSMRCKVCSGSASSPGWYMCRWFRRFTVSSSTVSRVWRKHQETGPYTRRGGEATNQAAVRRDL